MDSWKGAKDVEKQESVLGEQGNVISGLFWEEKKTLMRLLFTRRVEGDKIKKQEFYES